MKQRILVIGTGFAGLWSALSAARLLDLQGRDDIEVCVIAPKAELHVRPRFYEADVARMNAPLDALFTAVGVRFIAGWVSAIDSTSQCVTYRDQHQAEQQLSYSRLILASGSQVKRPPLSGVEQAFDVDSLEQAIALEQHLLGLAELPESLARSRPSMSTAWSRPSRWSSTCSAWPSYQRAWPAIPWWSPAAASPASRPPPNCRPACGQFSATRRHSA